MGESSWCTMKSIGIFTFLFTLLIVLITWIIISKAPASTINSSTTESPATQSTSQYSTTQNSTSYICEINPSGNTLTPFVVYTINNSIAYPQSTTGTIKVSSLDLLEFSCPTGNVSFNGTTWNSIVNVTCKSDDYFEINGTIVRWKNIVCSKDPKPSAQPLSINDIHDDDPNKICHENNLQIGVIGFVLDTHRFLGIVNICFNITSRIAVYSNHILTRFIDSRAENVTGSKFKQDDIFYENGLSVEQLYKNSSDVIKDLLGLEKNSTKYINDTIYINKGHLAPKADFYYANLQIATNRYINIAPQWNIFNEGNWQQAEKDVRRYAINNRVDLQIWTGTYGNCMLKNKDSTETPLYLYSNKQSSKDLPSFPVPEIFWKIVYNPINATGIILVGHNNPYHDNSSLKSKIICTDISERVSWLKWEAKNFQKGYSYSCAYNDSKFHELVKIVPILKVNGLL